MVNLLDPSVIIESLYNSHKYDKMYEYCKSILAKSPDDMTALQNASLALIYLEQYEDAILYCNRVLHLREFDEYALKNKLFALEALHRNNDVIEICEHILDANPKDVTALSGMGLALTKIGRHAESIVYYDRALDISPDDVTALLNKGLSLTYLKQYSDALSFYDRAENVDLLPSDTKKSIALARSKIFTKLKKDDEAFLAAQGVRNCDMSQIISAARRNNCSVFHQFCDNEYDNNVLKTSDKN